MKHLFSFIISTALIFSSAQAFTSSSLSLFKVTPCAVALMRPHTSTLPTQQAFLSTSQTPLIHQNQEDIETTKQPWKEKISKKVETTGELLLEQIDSIISVAPTFILLGIGVLLLTN